MGLSSIDYPCNMFDNTLFLTAFCSPSHFPCTPPSVFRDHLPSKLCALRSLFQGLRGNLNQDTRAHRPMITKSPWAAAGLIHPVFCWGLEVQPLGVLHIKSSPQHWSAAWPGPRPRRVLGQKLLLWVRALRAWLLILEECILSPSALSADLSLSRGGGPAADSKHTE